MSFKTNLNTSNMGVEPFYSDFSVGALKVSHTEVSSLELTHVAARHSFLPQIVNLSCRGLIVKLG